MHGKTFLALFARTKTKAHTFAVKCLTLINGLQYMPVFKDTAQKYHHYTSIKAVIFIVAACFINLRTTHSSASNTCRMLENGQVKRHKEEGCNTLLFFNVQANMRLANICSHTRKHMNHYSYERLFIYTLVYMNICSYNDMCAFIHMNI